MTESEVRDIVSNLNGCINRLTLENNDMDKRVKTLIEMIEGKQDLVRNLYRERENIIIESEKYALITE